ncbi:MAG: DUF433 domain-containing protein [Pirellulales bacterium]
MSGLDMIVPQLAGLDPIEREQLLMVLTSGGEGNTASVAYRSEFPSIVTTPDVCGGAARIVRTRIPVWTLEGMRRLKISESEILRNYPTLSATDLVQAWAYVAKHREEIDEALRANDEA